MMLGGVIMTAYYSLTDRSSEFPRLLAGLEQAKVSFTSAVHLPEKVTTRAVRLRRPPASLKELDLAFFRRYEAFPANILTFLGRWQLEQREMRVGDTILQQSCLPPISSLSVKIIMGVRVIEVIETDQQIGFTYATVDGHVERGTAAWLAELHDDEVGFVVHTRSQPADLLARLAAPVFTLRYQAWVTRAALGHLAGQFVQRNANWVE